MYSFQKTTSIDYYKYGEVYPHTNFKNQKKLDRKYYTFTSKQINHLFKAGENLYFTVKNGIGAIVIYENLQSEPKIFVIHRICLLKKGYYYNFIPISDTVEIEIINHNEDKYNINSYHYKPMKANINIKQILGIYSCSREKDYFFPGEKHEFFEISFVSQGELTTCIDGQEFVVKPHQLIFYVPNQKHNQFCKQKCDYITIIFDMEIDSNQIDSIKNTIFDTNLFERRLINNMVKLVKSKENENQITSSLLMLMSYLNSGASFLDEVHTSMYQNYSDELINRIIIYINDNLVNGVTVETLCNKFAISRSTIQLLFKNKIDKAPKEFIDDLIFEKARQLIENSTYSLTRISKMCGFTSIHYFSLKFKSRYGITPSQYAKQVK